MALRVLHAEPKNFSADARRELALFATLDERNTSRDDLIRLLPEYDVLWVRLGHRVDEEVLAHGRRLKAIVTATTGLNHIDLDAAARRGIEVLSLKDERAFLDTIAATAEHTWGLLLALVRRIPWAFDSVREGSWMRDDFKGQDLTGRTLGVVGCGRLGTMIAGYGQAFGMNVLVADPFVEKMPPGVSRLTLDELLPESDVVSLHVPLSPDTTGFFGASELSKMKPGSILINTSRGELIDEAALITALRDGHLSGAAVDVVSHERQGFETMASHPLIIFARQSERLLVTPHVGGATDTAMVRTEVFMAEKLRRWAIRLRQ